MCTVELMTLLQQWLQYPLVFSTSLTGLQAKRTYTVHCQFSTSNFLKRFRD